jgi:AraC-like DNA-binding protein
VRSYFEIAPPPRLAESVECFWVSRHSVTPEVPHRVLPDGCADILFTSSPGKSTLEVVGAMTQFQDYQTLPPQLFVGLRFHPGTWAAQVGAPANLITDRQISLDEFWGKRARTLLARMEDARSPTDCVSLLAESLSSILPSTPIQRALAWMRSQHGIVALDQVVRQAGLSTRQFRRLCLRHTGLSPKLLARILRFRYALSRVHGQLGEHAGLAADCGYFDQSHFIAEFQRFSGRTPANFYL